MPNEVIIQHKMERSHRSDVKNTIELDDMFIKTVLSNMTEPGGIH